MGFSLFTCLPIFGHHSQKWTTYNKFWALKSGTERCTSENVEFSVYLIRFSKSKALINSHRLKKPKDDQTDTNFIEFPITHLQSCFLKQHLKDILKWFF